MEVIMKVVKLMIDGAMLPRGPEELSEGDCLFSIVSRLKQKLSQCLREEMVSTDLPLGIGSLVVI